MREFIRGLSFRQVAVFFGALYVIALVIALFPPLYLYASGRSQLFLGMPLTVWYWLSVPVITTFTMWGLYLVEGVRGELDLEFHDTEPRETRVPYGHFTPDEEGGEGQWMSTLG